MGIEAQSQKKYSSALHGEHLNEGVKPLLVSYYHRPHSDLNPDNAAEYREVQTDELVRLIVAQGLNVDYDLVYSTEPTPGLNMIPESLAVISELSIESKYSEGFAECMGVVAVGQRKDGKNISLIAHFNVRAHKKSHFYDTLKISLAELHEQSVLGTVDIIIVGGEVSHPIHKPALDDYVNEVEELRKVIIQLFKFEPVVFVPKITRDFNRPYNTSVYLDTQNRQIVLEQPLSRQFELPYLTFSADQAQEAVAEWYRRVIDQMSTDLQKAFRKE